MTTLINMFTLLCTAYALFLMTVVAIGAKVLNRALRKEKLLVQLKNFSGNPLSEVGITVVVDGRQTAEELQRRLSMDYVMYEVVWVADCDCDCKSILGCYSMVAMSDASAGYVVYRSRERRYKHFTIIHHLSNDRNRRLGDAVAAASYDYVVMVDRTTCLTPDALQQFNVRLTESDMAGEVRMLCGLKIDGRFDDTLQEMDSASALVMFAGGFGMTDSGIGITALVERELLMEYGLSVGFDNIENGMVREMIRDNCGNPSTDWRKMLVTGIVSKVVGSRNALCGRERRNPLSGMRYVSSALSMSFTAVFVLLMLCIVFLGTPSLAVQLAVVGAMYYAVMTCRLAAATCLISHSDKAKHYYKTLSARPMLVFLYPFFRMRNIISDKNFVRI